MLVARFSDDITADINRGWSAWMTPGLAGTIEDCKMDIEDGLASGEIKEFPEYPGCFGIVHHSGLSCYELEAETIEEAIEECKNSTNRGDGFGYATVGEIKLLHTIKASEFGSIRDLHILEVEDIMPEI